MYELHAHNQGAIYDFQDISEWHYVWAHTKHEMYDLSPGILTSLKQIYTVHPPVR